MPEPKTLPPKLDLAKALKEHGAARAENLPDGLDKDMWVAYYLEKKRRKDPSLPGVAQEALDCVAWLKEQNRSPSESFTIYGYSIEWAYKPAMAEEKRILVELAVKPSKDIVESEAVALKVSAVMTSHSIAEFVPPDPIEIE